MIETAVDTVTPTVVACGGDDGRDGGGDSDGGELGGDSLVPTVVDYSTVLLTTDAAYRVGVYGRVAWLRASRQRSGGRMTQRASSTPTASCTWCRRSPWWPRQGLGGASSPLRGSIAVSEDGEDLGSSSPAAKDDR